MNHILQSIFRNKAKLLFLLFVISNGSFTTLTAQTNTYNGASGGNWNTPTNWSQNVVPTVVHDVVIPNNKNVVVNTAAVCKTFTINGSANVTTIDIGSNSLTVSGAVIIGAPTANNKTKSINITTGSLSCASITMGDTSGNTRICSISTTSGTVTVTGNITMAGAAIENQLRINGTLTTGGTLNIGGSLSGGDFSSSNLNSTINFNGTAAQTIPINASYIYNKVNINNVAGATLQAAITAVNVTDNITVQSGIFDNGGFPIAGNPTKTLTVANGATFKVSGTTSSFPSGFLTNTLGATSTVEYSGTGIQTIFDVASPGYGNFVISNNAVKTAAGALDIQGNVTINNTATLDASTFVHNIGGNWINNGIFTAGTSTINFNSTATGKTISGAITGASGKFNNLTFNGVGGSWTIASDLDIANTLTVTNGTVGMSGVLSVAGASAITVASGGTLTLENNASLIQSGYTGANSGNINVKRNTTPIILDDYTYWSSPTSGNQTLLNFSPNTQTDKFFTYHNSWAYADAGTDTFTKGIGYALRSPEGISPTVAGIITHQFTGVPNNGDVDVAVTVGPPISNRLVGNPYPSAIDADAFILANIAETGTINQTITGTLYFWTHNHGLSGSTYSASDYSTYNISGGTAVSTGTGNTTAPTGYIPSGQGFFVHTLSDGNISFNNSMRTGIENSNFNRTTNTAKPTAALEKNRIWLNLTNSTAGFSQALVGYIETATNDINPGFDGLYYGADQHVLYSLIDNGTYTIQARALPFVDTDIVPLGFKVNAAGETTISLDHVDGLFLENQNIYLEDLLLNVTHDLKQSPYTFTSEAGTFNNRFVLRYTNSALGVENFDLPISLVIASKNHAITIKSQTEPINQVTVYDILGRQIYENKKVNSNEILISDLMSNQALIIKMVLSNGQTVIKKLVY